MLAPVCDGLSARMVTPLQTYSFVLLLLSSALNYGGATCLPPAMHGRNRSQNFTMMTKNWLSHEIVTAAAQIVLQEVLGYEVDTKPPLRGYEYEGEGWKDFATGQFQADVEMWSTDFGSPRYQACCTEGGPMEWIGGIGYVGMSGLYAFDYTVAAHKYADYYKFFAPASDGVPQSWNDFVRFGDVDMTGKSFCDYYWCNGSAYVPPVCSDKPSECPVVLASATGYDTAFFESLILNHGLKLITLFLGWDWAVEEREIMTAYEQHRNTIFYHWQPDLIHQKVPSHRINFPAHHIGCPEHTYDIDSPVWCDYPEHTLTKGTAVALRNTHPEAYVVLKRYTVSEEELNGMMRNHVDVGDAVETACAWLLGLSQARWDMIVPKCIQTAPVNPQPGDMVFDPKNLSCQEKLGQVNCTNGTVYISSYNQCLCAAGQFLDGMTCARCTAGKFSARFGMHSCEECPSGRYSKKHGVSACEQCKLGFFSNSRGAARCEPCMQGRFSNTFGATSCSSCDAVLMNSTSELASTSSVDCICPFDMFKLAQNNSCILYFVIGLMLDFSGMPQYVPAVAAFEQDFQGNQKADWIMRPLVEIPSLSPLLRVQMYLVDANHNIEEALKTYILLYEGNGGYMKVHAIAGAHSSTVSIPIATMSNFLETVQVSPASMSTELSDKGRFPYFLRMVPSNALFGRAILAYISYFEFHACAVVFTGHGQGQNVFETLQAHSVELGRSYILHAHRLALGMSPSHIAKHVKEDGLNVVIVLVDAPALPQVISAFKIAGLWAPDYQLLWMETAGVQDDFPVGVHRVTLDLQAGKKAAFEGAISLLQRQDYLSDADFRRWRLRPPINQERFSEDHVPDPSAMYLFDALYAYAHAANNLIQQGGEIHHIRGNTLFNALQNLSFDGVTGTVRFDSNGDRIMNITFEQLQSRDGSRFWEKAGEYRPDLEQFNITSIVHWMDGTTSTKENSYFTGCLIGFSKNGPGLCHPDQQTPERTDLWTSISLWFGVVLTLFGFVAIGLLTWRFHLSMRSKKHDRPDSPADAETKSGLWTFQWVGYHIHALLSDCCGYTLLGESSQFSLLTHEAWCVNATQFDMEFFDNSGVSCAGLSSLSFSRLSAQQAWEVKLHSPPEMINESSKQWRNLSEPITVRLGISSKLQECGNVVRLSLPSSSAGNQLGQLKLVRGPAGLLLIMWSPAPELRGMPLKEFKRFLEEVIDHPGEWKCGVKAGSPELTVNKKRGDVSRNMYDACSHYIMPFIASVDASYAEARTDYGPADLFFSHVWAETAANTLKTISHFDLSFSHVWSETAVNQLMTAASLPAGHNRVWFCTCCNNQRRVEEELGSDVSSSAFARVISSVQCTKCVLISPLIALERKWCTFEFAFAGDLGKDILTATTQGILQAGQVPPKALSELATVLAGFTCANATCSQPEDAAMIDQAIADMGGVAKLDANLRAAFRNHIEKANAFTQDALSKLPELELDASSKLDEQERLRRTDRFSL